MNRFSASEAALEGFRLTRERPGTVLGWAGLYAVGLLSIGWLMLASLDRELVAMAGKGDMTQADLEAVSEMLAGSLPAFLLVLLLLVTLTSIITAGIFRIVLRPQEKGFLHLRLGPDELRLTAVNLILFAIGMVCLTTGILGITLAQETGSAIGFGATVLVLVLTTWIGIRLCLVTPMTFATGRLAIGPAWELSRGRFWPLLGMVVLALIFYLMVLILVSIIATAVGAMAGGQQALTDLTTLGAAGWIAILITLALNFIVQVLQIVMIYAPFAAAYQQLTGDRSAAQG
jgi:hypothetical protein